MATTPSRKTDEQTLDEFNKAIRSTEWHQAYLRSQGFPPGSKVKLNDRQREELTRLLASKGLPLEKGMKVDEAGNLNQKNTLMKNLLIGAGIGGAALTGFGLAGAGPLSGLGGAAAGGTGAAAGGAGTAAATTGAVTGGISAGSRILDGINKGLGIARQIPGVIDDVQGLFGQDQQSNAARGAVSGNMANQAAANRLREAELGQRGMVSDAQALANVQRSGMLANYKPVSGYTQSLFDKYGKRMPAVDAGTMDFASGMQKELQRRLAAGEPLTLSGIGKKSPQEEADERAAREQALKAGDTSFGDKVAGGIRIADATKGFLDTLNSFKRKPVSTGPGVTEDMQNPNIFGRVRF